MRLTYILSVLLLSVFTVALAVIPMNSFDWIYSLIACGIFWSAMLAPMLIKDENK